MKPFGLKKVAVKKADAGKRALQMIEEGADIIDIGGESSRPGSGPVSLGEEIKRVIPVVKEVARRSGAAISVDTTKSEVARQALQEGAAIINDISALTFDPAMAGGWAKNKAGGRLMHIT